MRLVQSAVVSVGIGLVAVALGCGGSELTGKGGAGASGSAGSAGSGGSAGTGGSGGTSGTGGTSGSGGSAGSGGTAGSPGGGSSPCPTSPPAAGGACTPLNLECEYGTNPNAACDTVFECNGKGADGTWMTVTPGGVCMPTAPACPTSYASISKGNVACPVSGQYCAYPEGTCACSEGGGPVHMGGPTWFCTAPSSGCPATRPNIGSSCTDAGVTCDYAACAGGIAEQCNGSYWVVAALPCPV